MYPARMKRRDNVVWVGYIAPPLTLPVGQLLEIMELIRITPPIDIDYIANRKNIITAVFVGIFSIAMTLVGMGLLSFMINQWRELNLQKFVSLPLCLLWILLFAAQTSLCLDGIETGISNIVKRKRWLKQAIHSQVKIIDRKEEYNDYAEYREEMWECSLAILWPPSTVGEQLGQVAWLRVSERIYYRYRDQHVANILCDPSNPNVFLFVGE